MTPDNRIALTAGDPGGVGPDLCLDILNGEYEDDVAIVVIGDRDALKARAEALGSSFNFADYEAEPGAHRAVWHLSVSAPVQPGELLPANAPHVLAQLDRATAGCMNGSFRSMVTAPVSKQAICAAGFDSFRGQTEYVADRAGSEHPVMLIAGKTMRVALATRHLPLSQVAGGLSEESLALTLETLDAGLQRYFCAGRTPRIAVAGLNPHAGEGGFIGDEETRIIAPAIARATRNGINAVGPFSADSMFVAERADCYVAMYHDQGLPVVKYADFDSAVNATLGLPFLRVSPDHGTAANLAGTGKASPHSMRAAVALASAAP